MTLVRCEYCQGRKTVPCPECEGRVRSTPAGEPQAGEPPASPCPACQGRARVECPGCLGTGYVDMPTFA